MASFNFNNLMKNDDATLFEKAVDSIQRRGDQVQLDIHVYLVAVATHWATSGDIRPAVKRVNALIAALPGGMRSNAIKAWVEAFMGFVVYEGEDKEHGFFAAGKRKGKDLEIKKLANARWWEFKPEPEYKGMDLAATVNLAIKKATQRIEKGVKPADNIDPVLLTALKRTVANPVAAQQPTSKEELLATILAAGLAAEMIDLLTAQITPVAAAA